MTLNNFTPSHDELAKWKVLQSPDLLAILKRMELGAAVIQGGRGFSYYLICTPMRTVSIRVIRTLERAGLIAPIEFDDYIEYRLTYTGSIEELVRK